MTLKISIGNLLFLCLRWYRADDLVKLEEIIEFICGSGEVDVGIDPTNKAILLGDFARNLRIFRDNGWVDQLYLTKIGQKIAKTIMRELTFDRVSVVYDLLIIKFTKLCLNMLKKAQPHKYKDIEGHHEDEFAKKKKRSI